MIHSDNIELASRCYALGVMNGEIDKDPEKFLTIKKSYAAGASFFSPNMHSINERPIKNSEIIVELEYPKEKCKDHMIIMYKDEGDFIPNITRWCYVNEIFL